MAQSQATFTSEIVGSVLATDSCEESVNALPKVVGFLRVLWFPPTGKLTGWVRINTVKKVMSEELLL
jgi:hypothetical protein